MCLLLLIILSIIIKIVYDISKKKSFVSTKDSFQIENNFMENLTLSYDVSQSYKNNKELINSFFNKKAVVIYRFEMGMCNSCIQDDLQALKEFQKNNGSDRIMVLPLFENNRNNLIAVKSYLSDLPFVYIPESNLIIPQNEELLTKCYFAYIDDFGDIEMIYFPASSENRLSQNRQYLTIISKIWGASLNE